MVAVAFRGSTMTPQSSQSTTTLPLTQPLATVIGDQLLAHVSTANIGTTTITPPAGWTLVRNDSTSPVALSTAIYSMTATTAGAASAGTFTWSASSECAAYVTAWSGVTSIASGASQTSTGASAPAPSVTTTASGSMLVCGWGDYTAGASAGVPAWTLPAAMTQAGGVVGTTNISVVLAYLALAAGGATGVQTATQTYAGGSGANVGTSIILQNDRPPNASTGLAPASNATIDMTIAQQFVWTFSDPDAGDTQSQFDLQYRIGTAAFTVVSGTTPNNYNIFPANTFVAANYEWQVRTYDSQGLVGPWSASAFFTAGTSPGVPTITAPTSGGTVMASPTTLTWSVPNQDSYQVRKLGDLSGAADTATVLYDSLEVINPATRSVPLAFTVNNRFEHLEVRVKYAGLFSSYADIRVNVAYTAPAIPTLVAVASNSTASIGLTITDPTPTGSQPTVTTHDIYRSTAGQTSIRIATGIMGRTWTDYTVASGVSYTYSVASIAGNGTRSTSASTGAVYPSTSLYPATTLYPGS